MIARFLFILCFMVPALACAELAPLPDIESLDVNTFVSQSQKIEKTFDEDSELNFTIDIPKDFIERRENLKNDIRDGQLYGEIYNAYGPAIEDVRAYVTVQSIELDRMISAKNWFISRVLQYGYTLRGIDSDDKGDNFEAFYIRLDDKGRTEIVRGRGFLHENRLVLVEYVIPTLLWNTQRDTQIFAIKSFTFQNEFDIAAPEKMVEYAFLDSFYTEFPSSWVFEVSNMDSVNQLDINLKTADRDRFIFAKADITLMSERSIKDRIDKKIYPIDLPSILNSRKNKISDEGFVFDLVMERKKFDLNFDTMMQVTEVYPLRKKTADDFVAFDKNPITREFWLTVIRTPKDVGKNYIISMTAPSRDTDMHKWALATKAYERMIESLR
jgi:hypothetical protein